MASKTSLVVAVPKPAAAGGLLQRAALLHDAATGPALARFGDAAEHEADGVAAQLMQPPSRNPPAAPKIGPAMRQAASSDAAPAVVDQVLRQPGVPLAAASRRLLEPRFGRDFSQVRVHADADGARSADAVQARAYTVGHHLVFNRGHFAPETSAGRALLAHELTHVVQQAQGARLLQRAPLAGAPDPRSDVGTARQRGRAMAKRVATHGLLSKEARAQINRELAGYDGAAKAAYVAEVRPVLRQVVPIEMPADYLTPGRPKPTELMMPFDDPQLCGGHCFTDQDADKLLAQYAPPPEPSALERQVEQLRAMSAGWGPDQDFAVELLRQALAPNADHRDEAVALAIREPVLQRYRHWLEAVDAERLRRYRAGEMSAMEIRHERGNGDDPAVSWFADSSRHGPNALTDLRRQLQIGMAEGGLPVDQVFYAMKQYRQRTDPHELEMVGIAHAIVDLGVGLAVGVNEQVNRAAMPPNQAAPPVTPADEPGPPAKTFGPDATVHPGQSQGDGIARGQLHDTDHPPVPKAPSTPPRDPLPPSAAGVPRVGPSKPAQNDNALPAQQAQAQKIVVNGGVPSNEPPSMVRRKVPAPPVKPRPSPTSPASVPRRAPANEDALQQKTVKPTGPPEDTHSVQRTPPGTTPEPRSTQVGNFAEKNFDRLDQMLKQQGIPTKRATSGQIPPGATRKYLVKGWQGTAPGGRPPEIDALDRAAADVIEIKPDHLFEQGLAEARGYAQMLDKLEPLPGGKRWQAKCLTYDGDAVGALYDHFFPAPPKRR